MNKNEGKKLIVWEGVGKELPWIIFWALIILMTYGYYQDKKVCEQAILNPCELCYKLNETPVANTIISSSDDYSSDELRNVQINMDYWDGDINESDIYQEEYPQDCGPNDRTISPCR